MTEEKCKQDMHNLFANTPLAQIVDDKITLITAQHQESVGNVLQRLGQHRILSMPVVKDDDIIAVVDLMDIVLFVVFSNFKSDTEITQDMLAGLSLDNIAVYDVVGIETELLCQLWHDGIFIMESDQSLLDAEALLIAGVKRLLVEFQGDEKSQYKYLSQSDALRYIRASLNSQPFLKTLSEQTIEEAGLLEIEEFNELCVMKTSINVLEAVRRMLKNKSDAIAVVDENEVLISTVTPSDIRELWCQTSSFVDLLLPIGEFLEKLYGKMRPPISVGRSSTIEVALERIVSSRIHRCWVVDDDNRPITCVRIQDLLVKFSDLDYKGID